MSSSLGQQGEDQARAHLEAQGYQFIDSNFRVRGGEIDLIMKQQEELIFVEVKTRRASNTVHQGFSLPPRKLERLQAAIDEYLSVRQIDSWRCELVVVTVFPRKAEPVFEIIPF